MYILANKNNVVVCLTTEAELKSDGIHVDNNTVFSDKTLQTFIFDSQIPDGVVPQKYCYIPETGFYLNTSYANNNDVSEKVDYILNKIDPVIDEDRLTLVELKALYISKSNAACDAKIDAGIDVELSTGIEHFSLNIKDQKNIDKIMSKIKEGMTMAPYHSDSSECKIYPASDILKISLAADMFITYNTTYANSINTWIRGCNIKEEVKQIHFGAELPEDLKSNMDEIIAVAEEEVARSKQLYNL